ncbi:MAG: riboflavin biosynthesis protein RibF [Myxococcales bacterium]|nr:riboflavin biosynthesis protein RibF [Myxococcales bacterium]
MKILRQLAALPPRSAACIGAFDGFHLGHQALLRRAATLEPELAVVTFDPHPAQVLAPERAPPLLQSTRQRERVCAELGVDTLVLLPFDHALARMSPESFVQHVLIEGLRAAAIVVGPDFRFGAGRRGGVAELRALLQRARSGVRLEIAEEIACPEDSASEGKLSSTGIRAAVRQGDMAAILPMLGRWFALAGVVVRGAQRGRTLGFPTANLRCDDVIRPRAGVYAGALTVVDERSALRGRRWPAVANLGTNPTFQGDAPPTLEVHALDASLDDAALYDLDVEFAFVERLRDEQRFPGPEALRVQIERDVASARERLTPEVLARASARPLRERQERSA